mmetsp:Transcript_17483/g.44396  ORF Transcript_17483/g.44396 Transcript_17483/m.44396 type:complete len:699 (-) Transcript_17483:252-2348(-)
MRSAMLCSPPVWRPSGASSCTRGAAPSSSAPRQPLRLLQLLHERLELVAQLPRLLRGFHGVREVVHHRLRPSGGRHRAQEVVPASGVHGAQRGGHLAQQRHHARVPQVERRLQHAPQEGLARHLLQHPAPHARKRLLRAGQPCRHERLEHLHARLAHGGVHMAGDPADERLHAAVEGGGGQLREAGGQPLAGERREQRVVRALQVRLLAHLLRAARRVGVRRGAVRGRLDAPAPVPAQRQQHVADVQHGADRALADGAHRRLVPAHQLHQQPQHVARVHGVDALVQQRLQRRGHVGHQRAVQHLHVAVQHARHARADGLVPRRRHRHAQHRLQHLAQQLAQPRASHRHHVRREALGQVRDGDESVLHQLRIRQAAPGRRRGVALHLADQRPQQPLHKRELALRGQVVAAQQQADRLESIHAVVEVGGRAGGALAVRALEPRGDICRGERCGGDAHKVGLAAAQHSVEVEGHRGAQRAHKALEEVAGARGDGWGGVPHPAVVQKGVQHQRHKPSLLRRDASVAHVRLQHRHRHEALPCMLQAGRRLHQQRCHLPQQAQPRFGHLLGCALAQLVQQCHDHLHLLEGGARLHERGLQVGAHKLGRLVEGDLGDALEQCEQLAALVRDSLLRLGVRLFVGLHVRGVHGACQQAVQRHTHVHHVLLRHLGHPPDALHVGVQEGHDRHRHLIGVTAQARDDGRK